MFESEPDPEFFDFHHEEPQPPRITVMPTRISGISNFNLSPSAGDLLGWFVHPTALGDRKPKKC